MRMRRLSIGLAVAAVVPLTLLAGWERVIEPALVKVPGGIHRTNRYSGTVSVFVDAKTAGTLATPQTSPMAISRDTSSVPGATGATTTALRETDTIDALGQRQEQTSVFVLDRSTVRNVFDDRSVAFGNNIVNRQGAFFPNLPFGVDNKRPYAIWNNEAGAVYYMKRGGGPATTEVNGVKVLRMTGTLPTTPVASYYKAELTKLGLPDQLTPAQLQAQLEASGVNVTQVADALGKVLPANEMLTIIGTLSSPLPLQYSTALTGDALIEPTTGIVVSTHSVKRFFAGPDPASLAPVKAILDRHASDPVVKAIDDNLLSLVGTPRPAFTLDYQTDAGSANSMAAYADQQRGRVRLARLILPAALLLLASALAVGSFIARRRQSKPRTPEPERALLDLRESPTREREPARV